MKKSIKSILALLVCFCLCLGHVSPALALDASVNAGVEFVATLDTPTITTSTESQKVIMRVKANQAFASESIAGTIVWDKLSGVEDTAQLKLSKLENEDERITLTGTDYNLKNGTFGWAFEWIFDDETGEPIQLELENITSFITATFTVPANFPAGTYRLGVEEIECTLNYGNKWNTDTSAYVELTVVCDHDFSKKVEDADHLAQAGADCMTHTTYYYECAKCGEKGTNTFEGTAVGEHKPAAEWSFENDTHYHLCTVTGCGGKLNTATCSGDLGSTANCQSQATCDICQNKYGELGSHITTPVAAQDERHTSQELKGAVDAHFACTVEGCGKLFTDAAGLNETTLADLTHPAPVHVYDQEIKDSKTLASAATCKDDAVFYKSCDCGAVSTTETFVDEGSATGEHVDANKAWEHDGTSHYHTCGCGEKFDVTACSGDKGNTKNCQSQATCEVCGNKYGELGTHTTTPVAAVAEVHTKTELSAAVAAHHKCTVCEKLFKDAAGTEETTLAALTGTAPVHTHDKTDKLPDAIKTMQTCSEDAIYYYNCICGDISTTETYVATGTATGEHVDADGKWEHDGTKHYHTCGCGKTFDEAACSGDLGNTKNCLSQATCEVCENKYGELGTHTTTPVAEQPAGHTEPGTKAHNLCSVCDKKFNADGEPVTDESLVIAPIGHVGATKHDVVMPSHTTAGTYEYYTCTVCNADYFGTDADADKVNSPEELIIEAQGHVRAELFVGTPATCTENGTRDYYYCASCDAKFEGKAPEAAELSEQDLILLATGHIRGEHLLYQEAGCCEDGHIEHWHCDVCGGNYTGRAPEAAELLDVVIPATGDHEIKYNAGYSATTSSTGKLPYYYCATTGTTYADELGTTRVDPDSLIIPVVPAAPAAPTSPDTADNSSVALYTCLMIAAIAGLAVTVLKKREN